jgi:hypothetical protein
MDSEKQSYFEGAETLNSDLGGAATLDVIDRRPREAERAEVLCSPPYQALGPQSSAGSL